MMKVLTFLGIMALAPMAASAQSFQDNILTQLTEQGFNNFTVSKTLLGRVRVTSQSATLKRELVFNPVTGEILRDYWVALSKGGDLSPRVTLTDPSDRDSNDSGERPRVSDDNNGSDDEGNDDAAEQEDKSDDHEDDDREDDDHEDDDHEDDDK